MPNALCVAIPVLVLLSGCTFASGEEAAGRRIEVAAIEGRRTPVVCMQAARVVAPAWPPPDRLTLSPPPFDLLRDGGFLTCRALQLGVVSAEAYRAASLDRGATLLRAQAAASLSRIGVRDERTVAELRDWHRASQYLQVGCQAAARLTANGAEWVAPDILSYCGALHAARATPTKGFLP